MTSAGFGGVLGEWDEPLYYCVISAGLGYW